MSASPVPLLAAPLDAAWLQASTDPDVFMMLPPVWDIIAVKR